MDNLSHTLIGLATGQALTRLRSSVAGDETGANRLRAATWTVSALANNFPDTDFLYAWITPGKLGYLLHHRGHTHTLVFFPVLAAILLGLVRLLYRPSKAWRPADWWWLAAAAALGPILHLFFDGLNSYGVHPFWPFDNRWYYGDSLFIVEPALWVLLLPILICEARSSRARWFLVGLLGVAFGLCFFTGFVPWQLTLLLTLFGLWFLGLIHKLKPNARAAATTLAVAGLIFGFAQTSSRVSEAVAAMVREQAPGTRVHDVAITPLPVNPLCWSVWTIETRAELYTARTGIFAAAPRLIGAAECPTLRLATERTFTLSEAGLPSRPEMVWHGKFEAPRLELLKLRDRHCSLAALLKFVRVPAWVRPIEAHPLAGDLRFDRSAKADFPELKLVGDECPKFVPDWQSPRRDLLGD